MRRKIIIYFDPEHTGEETIEEVLRLFKEGYTSGIDPDWEIVDEGKVKNASKH